MSKKAKNSLKSASLRVKKSAPQRSGVLPVIIVHKRKNAVGKQVPTAVVAKTNVVPMQQAPGYRRLFATFLLTLLLLTHLLGAGAVFAQTKPAPAGSQQGTGSQQPQGQARNTENTVPNPYADAIGQTGQVDQASNVNTNYIGPAVDKIITGEYTNVVFQAAEQGQGGSVQKIANNALNASLGSVNESYRGLHKWFQDDIVGNLFSNIGQLIGKWISEIINGWIADSVQFLAQFLRVFVLNPNIAVNGLDGSQNDGISFYVRQGADVMYGIAVDLLLLLFILCIWKYWAEASWRGAGNLMGPIGRLIFTAGLLLAWPTIYAFEVQISNEMIKAIYFNTNDQVAMLHYALASAVKGGIIAAGAAAMSVFAPILGNLAFGAAGPMVGSVFYFASMVVFLILGGVLIAELIYILVLKAIQTALLTAQYMFAPIFLVFFATPDTENIATGYVRAFVETSLWTFGWVGLLKIMVIIMFSSFNPWGKILIAVGVLQLMIQVPTFLARAQISPMSDFISAGLVTGGILKAMGGIGGLLSGGINTMIGMGINKKQAEDLYGSKDAAVKGLGGPAGDNKHLEGLNNASKTAREYDWSKDPRNKPGTPGPGAPGGPGGPVAPPVKNPTGGLPGAGAPAAATPPTHGPHKNAAAGPVPPTGPGAKPVTTPTTPPPGTGTGAPGTPGGAGAAAGGPVVPPGAKPAAKPGTGALTGAAVVGAGAAAVAAAGAAGAGSTPKDQYAFGKSNAEGWDEKNLINVDTRKLIGKITSVDGTGLRHGQPATSILGSTRGGVERVNIGKGADGAEMARAIYTAGFADNVSHDDVARDAARRSAADQKAWRPQGFKQGMIANWMEANGQSWFNSPWAKENFNKAMFGAAVEGSRAYIAGGKGNAYTDYLKARYGEWDEKQDASAIHLISNPESSESPWNRNIGPATEGLIRAGIPIGMDTRGAMQNMTIQGLHPARQKKAVLAALSYTYDKANELFGKEDPAVFALGHGELARSLPGNMVNEAIAIYEASGSQADLKPAYGSVISGLSGTTRQDLATSYGALAMSAPHVAASTGRLRANVNPASINTISDLEANIVPSGNGETAAQAFTAVMETTSAGLANGEMHGIPMRTIMNRDVGRGVFEFMGGDIMDTNSSAAHRKMRVIAQNLRTVGTPNDASTYAAIDTVLMNNGPLLSNADEINMARALMPAVEAGTMAASALPGAVSMAVRGGYHLRSTPVPIEAVVMASELEAGGQRMSPQKIQIIQRFQEANMSRDIIPTAIEVAVKGGYTNNMGSMDIGEIQSIAEKCSTGTVDTRYVPAIAAMVRAGESNITTQTARIVAEASSDLGGYQNRNDQYIKAVVRVAGGLQNQNLAPQVMETYVRAQGANHGIINADSLPLGDLLNQLGGNIDMAKVPVQIASIQRDGAMSAYQMQDPVAVNLMIQAQESGGGATAMQAVNVVTRLCGSQEASSNPAYIEVAQEYLGAGGKMRDFDMSSLQAAVEFAAVREAAIAGDTTGQFTPDVMQHLKISSGICKTVGRDMASNGGSLSQARWDALVAEAVKRATGGGTGGGRP